LFRNRPWLRFRNRVHEELVSFDPAKALMQERAGWVVHHFGKAGEQQLLRAKGEAYLRMGLKKIEDVPEDPLAHYELGVQYAELGRPQDAIGPFERTLELSPRFRDARLRIALCYKEMGNHAKALETLRAAAWTLPRYAAEIAFEEGNAHRALGDSAAAEGAFRRAISMNAGFVPASVNLALMFHGAGRTAEALTCLDRALQHSPQNGYLLNARAHLGAAFVRSLLQQQSFEEARDYLTNVADAVPGSPAEGRIFEHVRAGRFELAKRMMEKSA
jgi:tetratricopeptide (TPR) repeat protein